MTQQPWRKRAIALVMGKESVEVISYPGPSGGDILRTGALPLFSKTASSGIASGMRLIFRSSTPLLTNSVTGLPIYHQTSQRHAVSFGASTVCARSCLLQVHGHQASLLQCLGQHWIVRAVIQSQWLSSSAEVLNKRCAKG